ncbi:MAG: hypothetical protein B6D62_03210 [Candidatus Cloacimonas sp. 4484_275]|nr:MAG: hypothetical protein B6D62_03210 [Candidatus Cloacimonas sp. 4484_275]
MLIYNLLIIILFIALVPYLLIRLGKKEFLQRMGFIDLKFKSSVWIHAASVGEVNAVKPLVKRLLEEFPEKQFIITAMTQTGKKTAEKIDKKIPVFFLPFDCFLMMRRFFNAINPKLIILVETEFWPNMLFRARLNKIPVIVVNGRISDKSFPHYKRFLFFWKPLWKIIKAVNAQSESDAYRFRLLGFNKVIITNNLKFCLQLPTYQKNSLRKQLHFAAEDFVIVWGSSRPGEEKLLHSILPQLRKKIPTLKIVLVPRHLKRLSEIKEIFSDEKYSLFSSLSKPNDIVIVDKMGALTKFYALADLAIVGGSFYDFGGHNPLEPAFYGIPIIMGKYYHSCRDSVSKLLENNAIKISNEKKLAEDIIFLYKNKEIRKKMGKNAEETLAKNSESLEKNLEILRKFI